MEELSVVMTEALPLSPQWNIEKDKDILKEILGSLKYLRILGQALPIHRKEVLMVQRKVKAPQPKNKFIQELATIKDKRKPSANYVNNKEMLEAIIQYKKAIKEAAKHKKPKPKIPNILGLQLHLIAKNLSTKHNFRDYSFVEEMIGDAIENCIMYFDNFDPKKSKYPFTYFTKIIYFAFVRRIQREKRQLYVKYKATQQAGILHESEFYDEDNPGGQFEMYDNITEFIGKYEDAQKASKAKSSVKPKNLEKLIEKDDK